MSGVRLIVSTHVLRSLGLQFLVREFLKWTAASHLALCSASLLDKISCNTGSERVSGMQQLERDCKPVSNQECVRPDRSRSLDGSPSSAVYLLRSCVWHNLHQERL